MFILRNLDMIASVSFYTARMWLIPNALGDPTGGRGRGPWGRVRPIAALRAQSLMFFFLIPYYSGFYSFFFVIEPSFDRIGWHISGEKMVID
jgi:hypothetical protein